MPTVDSIVFFYIANVTLKFNIPIIYSEISLQQIPSYINMNVCLCVKYEMLQIMSCIGP
jgi:hypothetical protein